VSPHRTDGGARYGDPIPTAAFLSFRLGGFDGVGVESAKWQGALGALGFTTYTVAGEGPVDHQLAGLAVGAAEPPGRAELTAALERADLVVVENLCSLPLNPPAAAVVAEVLAGRPAVLHHHDLPWQRPHLADHPPPPVHRRWSQVTINTLSRHQLADRGVTASTVYNAFAPPPPEPRGRRRQVRHALGVTDDRRLVLQPTRAIPRKNVAGGLQVAADLGATFWLLGPAEDGYGPELGDLVAGAGVPVLLGSPGHRSPIGIDDAYRACDVVALPSTWEGFGNPSVESATHRRPLAVGPYPVAAELAAFGFDWFALSDMGRLDRWLETPDPALLDANEAVAAAHFPLHRLPERIAAVLPEM